MRPGPDPAQRTRLRDQRSVGPESVRHQAEALVLLSQEQRRLLAVLQTQQNGMTARQLQTRLAWPSGGVQPLLESLRERQLVAQLNTIVPSYVYRYAGVDLHAE